jgi:ribosomal protein S4E
MLSTSSASFSRWTKLWLIGVEDEQNFFVRSPIVRTGHTNLWASSIRYPDPAIKVNDTVKVDIATGKISDFVRFDSGVVCMVTGGRNMGRVGVVTHRERHDGGFNVVHVKDAIDNTFATRESNVFVIGQEKPWVSLPKGKGVKVCFLLLIYSAFSN